MDIGRVCQAYLDDPIGGRFSRIDGQYLDILHKLIDEYTNPSGDGEEIVLAIAEVIYDQLRVTA